MWHCQLHSFSICVLLDPGSGLLMRWGAPPGPWVPVVTNPAHWKSPGRYFSSFSLLAPPLTHRPGPASARPGENQDPWKLPRTPGSVSNGLVELSDRPAPTPTLTLSWAPTSAPEMSQSSSPVHGAMMGMLWLLLVGE